VEFPAVAKGEARFRLQVMARHSEAQLRAAAQRMRTAVDIARRRLQAGIDQPVASEIALAS
jgi:glycine C-acetyltransferase